MLNAGIVAAMLSMGLMVVGSSGVYGQTYPNKPIRIITSGAGGGGDFTARLIAQGISASMGQPVIVDNRGSGYIPGEVAYKSTPDGYTLLVQGGVAWVYPLLRKAPYDAVTDFAPISLVERSIFVVSVNPSVAAKSVSELIAVAKARPGALNFGSGSVGSTNHLAVELFASMAGINLVHVPSKGAALAITAEIAGETQLTIFDVGLVMPHVKSGKLRALAVTSAEPSTLAPGLPTVAASGLPGYESTGMTGMWAPAKTPGAIISRLNQEAVRAINRPDVKERFLNAGLEIVGSSPEQFAAIIKSDIARLSKVIKDAGIKLD